MTLASIEKSRFLRSEAPGNVPNPWYLFPSGTHTPLPPLYGMIRSRSSTGLSAKHPSPHPTCQFTSDLSQNCSQGLWRKAQKRTRPGACSRVSLLSEFTAAQTRSAPCSPTGLPHAEELPIFLHLIVLVFVHVSFTSQAQQAVLFSWTSVHKSWRARLYRAGW